PRRRRSTIRGTCRTASAGPFVDAAAPFPKMHAGFASGGRTEASGSFFHQIAPPDWHAQPHRRTSSFGRHPARGSLSRDCLGGTSARLHRDRALLSCWSCPPNVLGAERLAEADRSSDLVSHGP